MTRLGFAVAAAVGLSVAACEPSAPVPVNASDSPERTANVAVGGAPGLEVLASFALDYVLHGVFPEDEQDALANRYFIDAEFAPLAYFGRWAPPDDRRAWVQREHPLTGEIREELEGLGLIICDLGTEPGPPCDSLEPGERHLFLGIGDPERSSESRWWFDFGFGVLAPSGLSIGAARVVIRSHGDGWSVVSVRTTHMEH